MAIEDSTTDLPSGVEAPSPAAKPLPLSADARRLTVIRRPDGTPDSVPPLRIAGRWLDRAGFPVGSKVRVLVSQKRLVVELVEKIPERRPRLPRTIGPTGCVY